ncbi:MAG: sigma-70 family RNA polymerase sigma factor [Planctomycetota bacterium]
MDPTRSRIEADLRRAVLRGEDAAWRLLFREHAEGLRRAARALDREAAEDLIQEVWLVAVRRIRDFDPERGTFGAWLGGILRGAAANRRRRRVEAGIEDPDALPEPASNADPDAEGVETLLEAMVPEYREVLVARYGDGLPTGEIARRLGRTDKAVESLLGRAREAFRTAWRRSAAREDERRPR